MRPFPYDGFVHDFPIQKLGRRQVLDLFGHIPHPPKRLFIRGKVPMGMADSCMDAGTVRFPVFLTVVGTRRPTPYGIQACRNLIAGLRGFPVVIVSGLALGIDGIAHEAALDAGLATVAFPGSGLGEHVLSPRQHFPLAQRILENGGCLLSEYDEDHPSQKWIFAERNRLMAGMSRATLIVEATNRSGSRITTRLAVDYDRDVLAVPGPIFSELSEGPNDLIRQGAIPVTSADDILEALGFDRAQTRDTSPPGSDTAVFASPEERAVWEALGNPLSRDSLSRALGLPMHELNQILSMLEIKGLVREDFGSIRKC